MSGDELDGCIRTWRASSTGISSEAIFCCQYCIRFVISDEENINIFYCRAL
jgi:hypothetical protein